MDTTKRLIIKQMVLENFKSYAGKQVIGPFHKCFTSIVGPNGSGKSNVIDALLFVFGKRAKQIRQNKVGELVHRSGSEGHTRFHPNSTRVDVHFCDINDDESSPNDFTIIPGSEFVLSRTANTNNQSKYFINDRAVKFEEIEELLLTKGIDLSNNRFLIMQGEVEQLSLLPPKGTSQHEEGMLEYLEDIIGTSKYIPILEEKEKELESKQEERTEKINRVKVVEKEKKNLEASKLEAEEYIRTMRTVQLKKSKVYRLTGAASLSSVADRVEKKKQIEQKIGEENQKVQKSRDELHKYDQLIKEVTKEHDELTLLMNRSKAEFTEFQRKDAGTREEIKQLRQAEKKAEKKYEQEQQKLKNLDRDIKVNEGEKEKIQKELVELRERLPKAEFELNGLYEKLKGQTLPLQTKLDEKQKKLIPVHTEIDQLTQKITLEEGQIELINRRVEEAREQQSRLEKELEETRIQNTKAHEKREELQKIEKQQKLELEKVQNDLQTGEEKVKKLSDEIIQLNHQVSTHTQNLKESKGRHVIRDHLAAEARQGRLKGLIGRLGDLGTISSEYDIAATTAGPGLENIVVETAEAAQWCADYLKEKKLGRTTFIILDKLDTSRKNMSISKEFPAETKRLFDLISVADKKFLPAFYFAFGDTLVAKDLATATKVSQNKWKVVTLNGAVVNVRGTMAGGGRPRSGGMGTSLKGSNANANANAKGSGNITDEKELTNLIELQKKKTAELARAREELIAAEELFERYKKTSDIATELQKLNLDIPSLTQRTKDLNKQLSTLRSKTVLSSEEEKDIKQSKKQISILQEKRDELITSSANDEKEVSKLKGELMNAGGIELTTLKSRVSDIQKRIEQLEHDLTRTEASFTTHQRGTKKLEKAIEASKKEVESIAANISNVQKVLTEHEDSALVVLKAFEEAKQRVDDKSGELAKLVSKSDEFRKVVSKWASKETSLREELENHTRAIDSATATAQQWMKKSEACLAKAKEYTEILEEGEEEESNEKEKEVVVEEEELAESEVVEGKKRHSAINTLNQEIAILEATIEKLTPNMASIAEYKRKEKIYLERCEELAQCTKERDLIHAEYEVVRKKRLDEFMDGFCAISMKLKEMYQMITLGGDAELELVDSLNPFAEGIVFSVRPPKKSWKNISNLSGGEKTLSSLALVFSLHSYKPTPLYVMDEIDAALDFKNVSIVANYIKERTKNAQFVIISLRNYMFELADQLVGIYKTDNCTKSATITPSAFAVPIAK